MLNKGDIDYMNDAQMEIYELRQRPVEVIYLDKQVDPNTGVVIGEEENTFEVQAVVTELSQGIERTINGGVVFEEGDIKVDVKIEYISDVARKIERMKFDNESYEILSVDKKGISRRNRYEIIGRLIA